MRADVSVILPSFNSEGTILRAIDSIISQTLLPEELVIIDDGSDSPDYLARIPYYIGHRIKHKIIRLPQNRGASHARNIGVTHASSTYLAFIDADDCWHVDKLNIQLPLMIESGVNLSAHRYISNLNTTSFPPTSLPRSNFVYYQQLLLKNHFATPTVVARKSHFLGFDENLKRMEDYKCWLENTLTDPALLIDLALAGGFKRPIGQSGLSANMHAMHRGAISAFGSLYRERKINLFECALAMTVEYAKYPVRVARATLSRHKEI
ncbi:glycosyltransferase family 2 protein [Vogesella indigofera]|uniref:glycosyltransferase family 2 protein n=1 Tax=Vogesella indigofera TaxID=45465 RepID=UPI00234C0DA5|nr:glycosyltransferase family 2 protein [Vogesella indigofera]MDC7704760.1 glycosyltransferase family 2 protein [Vogesella indigofera]